MTASCGDPWPDNYWGGWYPNYQPFVPPPSPYWTVPYPSFVIGCICPVEAEKTCQGPMCPRKPLKTATAV